MTIQLPIAPQEHSSLVPSLFQTLVEVHVRIALLRVAAKAGAGIAPPRLDAMPFELQLGLVATAVIEAARCMPAPVRERLAFDAERIALEMLGAELVFVSPDAGDEPYPRTHVPEPS